MDCCGNQHCGSACRGGRCFGCPLISWWRDKGESKSCHSFIAWNWFLTIKAASKFFFNLRVDVIMLSWPLSSSDPQKGPYGYGWGGRNWTSRSQVPYMMTVASLGLELGILAPFQTNLWAGQEALSRKQDQTPSTFFSPSNTLTAIISKNEVVSPSLTFRVENFWYWNYIHNFTFAVVKQH